MSSEPIPDRLYCTICGGTYCPEWWAEGGTAEVREIPIETYPWHVTLGVLRISVCDPCYVSEPLAYLHEDGTVELVLGNPK